MDIQRVNIIIVTAPPLPDKKLQALQSYVDEDKEHGDPTVVQMQEMSPEVQDSMPESRRPSFLPEGRVDKFDVCRYPIPVPTYLKGENAKLTYYTGEFLNILYTAATIKKLLFLELIPKKMGILRASTCQTNPNFSKYLGRQSMGNALSALVMLRLCKAKHWIPKIVDNILKYGETLYR